MEETKLLTIGNNKVSLTDFQNQANSGLLDYLTKSGMSDKRKTAFMLSYQHIMDAINNGNISVRDNSKRWIDNSGVISNDADRKKDYNGEVAYYLDSIADNISPYKAPDKTKFTNNELGTYWKNAFFGGKNPSDLGFSWLAQGTLNGKFNKANNAKYLSTVLNGYLNSLNDEKYNNYDFTGTGYNNILGVKDKVKGILNLLGTDKINQGVYDLLRSIGLDPTTIFENKPVTPAATTPATSDTPPVTPVAPPKKDKESTSSSLFVDPKKAYNQDTYNQLYQKDPTLAELYKSEYETEANEKNKLILSNLKTALDKKTAYRKNMNYYSQLKFNETLIPNKYSILGRNPNAEEDNQNSASAGNVKNPIIYGQTFMLQLGNRTSNTNAAINAHKSYVNELNKFNHTGLVTLNLVDMINGMLHWRGKNYNMDYSTLLNYLTPLTGERNKQYVINGTYDSNRNVVAVYNDNNNTFSYVPVKYLPSIQGKLASNDPKIYFKQLGGTLALRGLLNDSYKKYPLPEPIPPQKQPLTTRPNSGLSSNLRWASVGLDLASLLAAYEVGPGTVASGVTGAASSLANFGADLNDGTGILDATGTLLGNLGLDAVGLVPGVGTAGKIGKVAKNLPYVLAAYLMATSALNYKGIYDSATKLMQGKSLSVLDARNLMQLSNFLIAGGKYENAIRAKNKVQSLAMTNDSDVKLNNGKYATLTSEQLETLKSKRTLGETLEYLKSIGVDENVLHPFKPNSGSVLHLGRNYDIGFHNPNVVPHYDYTKIPNLTNKDINTAAVIESTNPLSVFWVNPVRKSLKAYRANKPTTEALTTASINKPELVLPKVLPITPAKPTEPIQGELFTADGEPNPIFKLFNNLK